MAPMRSFCRCTGNAASAAFHWHVESRAGIRQRGGALLRFSQGLPETTLAPSTLLGRARGQSPIAMFLGRARGQSPIAMLRRVGRASGQSPWAEPDRHVETRTRAIGGTIPLLFLYFAHALNEFPIALKHSHVLAWPSFFSHSRAEQLAFHI